MPRRLQFVLLAFIVSAVVNPGNFGTIDTVQRLQVARWLRLGEPQVRPQDAQLGLGITGKDGTRQAWYGIGQSLVLLPFDAAVSAAVSPALARAGFDPLKREQAVELAIAFLMQWLITAGVLILAYRVLLLFGFSPGVGAAGALSLLFATSCLQYVQCAQENALLLLLFLCALWAVLMWRGTPVMPLIAGAACGFAILVRLTSLLETAALAAFALSLHRRPKTFLAGFLPPVLLGLALDRGYHYYRFGELTSTYIGIFGRQWRPAGAPASFPFSYPFWKGLAGALFSPDKSVFLFDPLLPLVLLLALLNWRAMGRPLQQAVLWFSPLLLLYIVAYARYFDFGGDAAWGDRFVLLPVHLLCLFAVPLLLAYPAPRARWVRRGLWSVVVASVALQAASTALASNVEIIQRENGYRGGVVWNRAVNVAQLARGQAGPRFAGIPPEWRTWDYLPFQLRLRFPRLAAWAVAAWLALVAAIPFLAFSIVRGARRVPY